MSILAFDTATDRLTVAVGRDKEIFSEANLMAPKEHMERLLPTIDQILKESKTGLNDIDAICVGLGPGSFTGVRIGVSTARGLAQSLNKKIVGISTSDSLAYGLDWEGKIACVVDAKRGEVYSTFYQSFGNKIERSTDHKIQTPDDFCDTVNKLEEDRIIITGDALVPYGQLLEDKLHLKKVQFAQLDGWYPKASNLVKLCSDKISFQNGSLLNVQPIYIRFSQAEEVWRKKQADRTVNIVLDVMKLKDLDEVLKIEKRLFPSPWSKWMFAAEIESERSFCFVARSEGAIIGYAVLNYIGREGHLLNLAVVPDYQNLSIGSTLVARLIKFAMQNGVRRLTLEVRTSNIVAQRLYQKFGFQKIGVRKKYYAETNEDGLILWTGDITFQSFQEKLNNIEKQLGRKIKIIDNTSV